VIVFVHGVPETKAIWRKVMAAVDRDSIALELPGFGCERPAGFGATKEDYVEWLLGELDTIEGPIDLVGHDWGAALVYRVATTKGDRLHSWAADVAGLAHPDYVWHDFAKIWQTPGEGEAFFQTQSSTPPEQRAPLFEAMGVPHDDALEMMASGDETMGDCILALYRSAVPNIHADWGPWSPTSAPGLVISAPDDPFGDTALAAEVAASLGARVGTLEGVGHFWPYQAPEAAAALLESFWSSLD
jgi:pimeloyl-ACP methyl ester carboxylesterase